MKLPVPAEIGEAIAALESAERGFPSADSCDGFSDACQLLEDCLATDDADDELVGYVANVRSSYARRLLEQTLQLPMASSEQWFPWVALLRGPMRGDVAALRDVEPGLVQAFESRLVQLGIR